LIKQATERLILISPYLRFNDRVRELLEDKNRLKIDIRIIYGKNELQPEESAWLRTLDFVRLSFCKNLHAKCYLNEGTAIVTSMNLYEFSQVNNNEMGILVQRESDGGLFSEVYQEAQRLIRISDEVKISVERVMPGETPAATAPESPKEDGGKLVSTTQLAKSLNIAPRDLFAKLQAAGWIARDGESWVLTKSGEAQGGEVRRSKQYGDYIVWPTSIKVP
jgi:phosphatidylserine/phosphatidylglycerophosphate/cardiolipin synthase-like enzyme